MKIEILLFAQLKESFGTDSASVEVNDGETVRDAVDRLLERLDDPRIGSLPLSFAVNEEFVGADYRLREGDRLAVLTPVSGG